MLKKSCPVNHLTHFSIKEQQTQEYTEQEQVKINAFFMEDLCKKGEKGKHRMGWGEDQAVLHIFSTEQPSKSTISQAIGVGTALQMDQQQPLFIWASQSRWSKYPARGFLQQKVLV